MNEQQKDIITISPCTCDRKLFV